MKLSWVLIIIGVVLILEGTTRIYGAFLLEEYIIIFGGLLTGWALGSFLLYRGIKRYKRVKLAIGGKG